MKGTLELAKLTTSTIIRYYIFTNLALIHFCLSYTYFLNLRINWLAIMMVVQPKIKLNLKYIIEVSSNKTENDNNNNKNY